jgi:hypothetical protein
LIRSNNQQESSSIFDQLGNIFSSLFSFLSWIPVFVYWI